MEGNKKAPDIKEQLDYLYHMHDKLKNDIVIITPVDEHMINSIITTMCAAKLMFENSKD